MRKRGRSRKASTLAAAGIAAAVLATGGAVTAYATSRTPPPSYVTAAVDPHPVVQTLQATGTTEPSTSATVSFAVSGTVATVPVHLGDKVTKGQVLATLDTTLLKYALATAQAQVANTELTLGQAQSGQVSATSTATSGKTSSAGTGSTTGSSTSATTSSKTSAGTGGTTGTAKSSGSTNSGSGSTAAVAAAQKRLLATVRQTDSALASAKTDLATATTLCLSQTSPTPSSTATPTATPTDTATATPTATSTDTSTNCAQAQQTVLLDESHLFTLQQGLAGQETALNKLLASHATSTGTAAAGTTAGGTASASTGTATHSSSTGSTGSTTPVVSAAQLAADQAAIDAAKASLAVAQQQLNQATIVSPYTGVVSSVGLTVGQQATAGSTTTAVDVIDPTGHGVTLSVDVTKVPQIKVGQKATVVPDGSSTPLAATVSYVAAAPATTGSAAYTVQLAFVSNPTTLRYGIQAAVTITTAQAANALAVPTSAVNHRGALDYVLVPNGSTTKAQIITVGALGAVYTQVTQGLTAGQKVVLANPNQAIPTNTITGRIARITGGVTNTTGVLGGSTGATTGAPGTRPGG
jgi:multidrug efflux pump subunit AcrA (membrane-fusion protein)